MSGGVLLVLVLLISVNALYVAAEFALVGVRVTLMEQMAAQGRRLAGRVLPVLRDTARLDRHIAACQIGITLSSLVLGAFGQSTLGIALGAWLDATTGLEPLSAYALSATITLVALTSVQVILGELIPKTLALQFPVATSLHTFLPLSWSVTLFTPFIKLLNGSGTLVLRLFGVRGEASHRHVHSPEEIDLLIRESREGGMLEPRESKRLREALQLAQHKVRQLMVPRRRIFSLHLDTPIEDLLEQTEQSPYTRILVHQGNPDEPVGFIHVKDVAAALARGRELKSLRRLVRPLLVLPSSLTLDRALGQLRDQRARIALLVDEYGDVEGLISLDDIIRELLGEISDEFKKTPELEPTSLGGDLWRLPGRLPFDETRQWAQSLGWPIESASRAETRAGWLLEQLDAIPEGRCALRRHGIEFEIESLEGTSISSVLARLMEAPGEEERDG